jgi:hypothetical protein
MTTQEVAAPAVQCVAATAERAPMQIEISRKGVQVQATADSITLEESNRLILKGQARLHYAKDGQKAEVRADHIEISLNDGTLKIKP